MRFLAPDPYRQTFRLLEAFLALIWVNQFIDARGSVTLLSAVAVLGIALLLLGQIWVPGRRWAWLVGIASSYLTIVLDPSSVLGPVIGLSAAYMIYNSELWERQRTLLTVFLGAGLVTTQVLQGLFHESHALELGIRSAISDIAVGVLLGLYRPIVVTEPDLPRDIDLSGAELTERERTIVMFLQSGLSKKEISLELQVSYEGLRKTLSRIYPKFGVADGVELARLLAGRRVVIGDPRSENSRKGTELGS